MASLKLSVSLCAFAILGCSGAQSANEDVSQAEGEVSAGEYKNPIIPMTKRPPGAPTGGVEDTEGCPDPMGMKTSKGEFYVFCTSYTWSYSRYDGMPIYKSAHLGGNDWQRAGSIIPSAGASRHSWPTWIKDGDGKRRGSFWAPDVHELPNGTFAATYAAPCGDHQCIGVAWAENPAGPWKHKMNAPFIHDGNNGANLATDTYDGNLLVDNGELYFYWVVGGSGIWGAKATASSGGEISLASAPVHIAHHGEGAYMIQHAGTYYLFSSTGSLYYGYNLSVRRGATPLTPHLETCSQDSECDTGVCESGLCEGRLVLERSENADGSPVKERSFVATGGNSVIQNAVGGTDFMVYHAIVVPEGKTCPRVDPTDPSVTWRDTAEDPYCRIQGDRQAMIDPITWRADGWPTVRSGTPSTGTMSIP